MKTKMLTLIKWRSTEPIQLNRKGLRNNNYLSIYGLPFFLKIHISWKRVKIHFLIIFELLAKNLKYMTLCWRVKWYLSLMDALEYVSRIRVCFSHQSDHSNEVCLHRSECYSIVLQANHIIKLGYCHMLQWNQTNIDKHQKWH